MKPMNHPIKEEKRDLNSLKINNLINQRMI